MNLKTLIHADGACAHNPGPGGWAYNICIAGVVNIHQSGGAPHTTNNAMEMDAVIHALRWIHQQQLPIGEITLRLDSRYVLDGLEKWSLQWRVNNWRNTKRQPISNQDRWRCLDQHRHLLEADGVLMQYEHVRGHTGDVDNTRVDQQAVQARDISRTASHPWHGDVVIV